MQLPPAVPPAVLGLALLLALVAQFVPVAHFEEDQVPGLPPGSVTAEATGYVWRAKLYASIDYQTIQNESRDSKTWYDNDFDGEKGIGDLRAAAPLLAVACALLLAGALAFLRMPLVGSILGAVAVVLLGIAIGLLATGMKGVFDDQQEWTWGFWILLASGVVALVGTVLGFVMRPRKPTSAVPTFG